MMLLAFAVVNVAAVVSDATVANISFSAIAVVNDNEVANVAAAAAISLVVLVNNTAVAAFNAAAVNDAAFSSLLQLQWSMILKLQKLLKLQLSVLLH